MLQSVLRWHSWLPFWVPNLALPRLIWPRIPSPCRQVHGVRRWVLCMVLTAARHQSGGLVPGAVCSQVMLLYEYNRAELVQ